MQTKFLTRKSLLFCNGRFKNRTEKFKEMRGITILLLLLIPILSCKNDKTVSVNIEKEILKEKNHQKFEQIPQGKFKYEIYFAEFGGRMPNRTCNVEIKGNNITVTQDETTNLTGGEVIFKGMVLKHKSGKWILADKKEDIKADEIGRCTEIPIIYFDKKLIEWC